MKIKTVVISALVTLFASSAFAGQSNDAPVEINSEEMFAMGNMKSARFSDNDFEFIGCGTRTTVIDETESFEWGFCQAGLTEDGEGNAFCFTQNADLITQIKSLASYSFITFRWDENGDCTNVGSSTQSFYIPNKKDLQKK